MGLIGFICGFSLLLTQFFDVTWEHIILISAAFFLMIEGIREVARRNDKP